MTISPIPAGLTLRSSASRTDSAKLSITMSLEGSSSSFGLSPPTNRFRIAALILQLNQAQELPRETQKFCGDIAAEENPKEELQKAPKDPKE